ncbi:hypothetical protein HYX07_05080 [Candidatus Woesearchaeota archaeon]|nr:hypothetical protein [Candidatus Woesearchaeota archaeon]
MGIIRRDINKTLVISVIVLSIIIVSIITFYEIRLMNVVLGYNQHIQLYNWATANAIVDLNRTIDLKNADRKYLEMKYSQLAAQNSKLLDDIENLRSQLILAKSTMEYQKARDGGPVAQFRMMQSKNTEISELKEKLDALCLMLNSNNLSAGEC